MNKSERYQALMQGKRVFRACHIITGARWEGIAKNQKDALKKAKANYCYPIEGFVLKEFTSQGEWKKCKEAA